MAQNFLLQRKVNFFYCVAAFSALFVPELGYQFILTCLFHLLESYLLMTPQSLTRTAACVNLEVCHNVQ